jgi:tetratricopeptide (TPR) repeat protein
VERSGLHARFARALGDEEGPPDASRAAELAYHWQAALDLPRAFDAWIAAGLAAETIYAFAEARADFEQALALVPAAGIEPGPAALRLGKLYRSQGYDDSAIEELETALTLGEADAESLGILGDICRARGLAEEAVNFYQEAIAHDPSRLVLHTSLVASLATLRQYAEAAAALRSALRHLPSSGLLKETLSSMEALAGSASAVATGADDAS